MARAQLIHIEVDRRLGHEWDEWNGRPLYAGGNFSAPPRLFFTFAALAIAVATGAVALLLYLIGPRLAALWPRLPPVLWIVPGVRRDAWPSRSARDPRAAAARGGRRRLRTRHDDGSAGRRG